MKKIISLILCLSLLCTLLYAFPAAAELGTEKIEGKTFYVITSADDYKEFYDITKINLAANAILKDDIDLKGWECAPIGGYSSGYTGIFDGGGHIIRNFNVTQKHTSDATQAIGMFGGTNNATVKNLGLENISILKAGDSTKDGGRLGALVGNASGTTVIENCYVKNSLVLSAATSRYIQGAGSVTGFIAATGSITNCYAVGNRVGFTETGTSSGSGVSVSCFVGYTATTATADTIKNCYARGNTLLNLPDKQNRSGFARFKSSGNNYMAWTNSYTDLLTGADSGSSMTKYETDANEWKTLASSLGAGYKDDIFAYNDGLPRLLWEKQPQNYKITVSAEHGTVSAPEEEYSGNTVSMTVTPDEGYIVEWVKINGKKIESPYSFEMPYEDVEVTVSFITTHTITVSGTQNGSITAPEKAYKGETVILTVVPDKDYKAEWVKVNGEEIKSPYTFVMPDEAVTVTASFILPYVITVIPPENGTVSAPKTAFKDDIITLSVKPTPGYRLVWLKINDEELKEPYSFKMPDGDVTVTVLFEEIPEIEMETTVIDGKTFYKIETAGHYKKFVELANKDLTINGILMADIDLIGWKGVPIGIYDRETNANDDGGYSGIFDGNGHVISNLSITKEITSREDAGIGMFAQTFGATIKNLGLNHAKIISTGTVHQYTIGALVARARGTTNIDGCFVKNSVIKTTQKDYYIEGGGSIAGFLASTGTVSNCYAAGNTIGFDEEATFSGGGGLAVLVGFTGTDATADTIRNCYAISNTIANIGRQVHAGFARFGYGGLVIGWTDCYTDLLLANDLNSPMTKFDTDAPEWASLAEELGPAYKNGIKGIFSGAPRLLWEKDPLIYNISSEQAENGTVTVPESAYEDESVSPLIIPAEGYSIDWMKVNGINVEAPFTFRMPPEDAVVTAAFMLPHNVTVVPAQNGNVTAPAKAFRGDNVELAVTPAYSYLLDWVKVNGEILEKSEEGESFGFIMPDVDVTITAQFISAHIIGIPDLEHGTVTSSAQTAFRDDNIELTVTPEEGYRVDWVKINGELLDPPYTFKMPDEDVAVTARFMPPYNIIVTSAENGKVTAPEKVFRGESVKLNVLPDSGYTLDTVTVNGESLYYPYRFTMPEQDVTVVSKFITIAEKEDALYSKEDADEALAYINENCTANYITSNIKFLSSPSHRSEIKYTSSDESLISADGRVNRPKDRDREVTVTITVTRPNKVEERTVSFIVKKDNSSQGSSGGSSGGGGGGGSGRKSGGGGSTVPLGGGLTLPASTDQQNNTNDDKEIKAPFKDIENHWAKEYIEALYKREIISGKSKDTFAPDDNITREEFVTLIVKAFGLELSSTGSRFMDVRSDDWFAPYIMTAYENKIANGISEDEFGVGLHISRQDMCVMVCNALKNSSVNEEEEMFSDDGEIAGYAKAAVYCLKQAGIISGRGGNLFKPHGTATRAEAAKIIAVLLPENTK